MNASLRPTDREVGIFHWLWMLRVLTLDQILRLQYFRPDAGHTASRINLRKRLRALEGGGFLEGLRLRERGKLDKVFLLGPTALPHLATRYGIGQKRLYTPHATLVPPQLLHPLMVAECAVCMVESLRGTSVTTPALAPFDAPFYGTHVVENPRAKRHVKRFLTQEDIQGLHRRLRIRPDLVFALRRGDAARLYFLEADRGREGAPILAEKMEAYQTFLNLYGSLWKKYHPTIHDARVLVVFDSPHRFHSILRALSTRTDLTAIRWATLPSLKGGNAVFGPLWRRADRPEVAALMVSDDAEHPIKTSNIRLMQEAVE